MEASDEQKVWNRAALEAGGTEPREGDRALAALLLAHGMIMNGGIQRALESLSTEELEAAIGGYQFYSLDDAARLLTEALNEGIDDEKEADERYAEAVPDDEAISARFRTVFAASRNVFSP